MKLLIFSALLAASAFADTTISPTAKFAYSANTGWINFRPDQPVNGTGLVFGEFILAGQVYGANVGWIHFGSGSPTNGIQYQNNSASDYGVNHDGAGNLSGYAYGANIGWISFAWANNSNANRPRVNLLTGEFSGYAYSANMGWINLGTGNLTTTAMRTTDSDNDGINDAWEQTYFGNLTSATATSDADHDGVTDLAEYNAGTAPDAASDYFKILSTTISNGFTQATVVFTTDATRLYRIESSDDLVTWTNSSLGTFSPDAGLTTTKTLTMSVGTKKFFRAIAVKPFAN